MGSLYSLFFSSCGLRELFLTIIISALLSRDLNMPCHPYHNQLITNQVTLDFIRVGQHRYTPLVTIDSGPFLCADVLQYQTG